MPDDDQTDSKDRETYCPGCNGRVMPGQSVVSIGAPQIELDDPSQDLWHQGCRDRAVAWQSRVFARLACTACGGEPAKVGTCAACGGSGLVHPRRS